MQVELNFQQQLQQSTFDGGATTNNNGGFMSNVFGQPNIIGSQIPTVAGVNDTFLKGSRPNYDHNYLHVMQGPYPRAFSLSFTPYYWFGSWEFADSTKADFVITGSAWIDFFINMGLFVAIRTSPIWYRFLRMVLALWLGRFCVRGFGFANQLLIDLWVMRVLIEGVAIPIVKTIWGWAVSLGSGVVLVYTGLGVTFRYNVNRWVPKWMGSEKWHNLKRRFGMETDHYVDDGEENDDNRKHARDDERENYSDTDDDRNRSLAKSSSKRTKRKDRKRREGGKYE